MTHPDSSATTAPATMAPASPNSQLAGASPWPVFWVASVAVFLVSMDDTMLFAAFNALRAGFPRATDYLLDLQRRVLPLDSTINFLFKSAA